MAIADIAAIRGATTVAQNTAEEIKRQSVELMTKIIAENNIDGKRRKVVSIVISTTKDITAYYPAAAIRLSGIDNTALFSCVEPDIEGALALCIRLMVTVSDSEGVIEPKHIYLHGAAALRPDLKSAKE